MVKEKKRREKILFASLKDEKYSVQDQYKKWYRHLASDYKVVVNKECLSLESLDEVALLIFAVPRNKFTGKEFSQIITFLKEGGNLLFICEEGGDNSAGTNVNFLLEQFGISFNPDAAIRTVFEKYKHPKELLIKNGVINRGVSNFMKLKLNQKRIGSIENTTPNSQHREQELKILYPFGCTLRVQKPAVSILSSSYLSYPVNRPVVAVSHVHSRDQPTGVLKNLGGKIAVFGSGSFFVNKYISQEHNQLFLDAIVNWLLAGSDIFIQNEVGGKQKKNSMLEKRSKFLTLDHSDAVNPTLSEYNLVPFMESLCEDYMLCLDEGISEQNLLPKMMSFCTFGFDNLSASTCFQLREKLGLEKSELELIRPDFETPLIPLFPATFPPIVKEIEVPSLEQHCLEESFSSCELQLFKLAGKCVDSDIEFFILESSSMLVTLNVGSHEDENTLNKTSAKEALGSILFRLFEYKCSFMDLQGGQDQSSYVDNLPTELESNALF
eukprot:snap_masked-scaffold_1-processed-gene-16.37-mRNA-1 protein AED:0.71 eAED:0.71 QI:0/-1/0/1/-1/1/1/0/495